MKPKLAILYGQAPEFSTSFQTRELAKQLQVWFEIAHHELPANCGPLKRQFLRATQRFFSPAFKTAPGDFLLYGNDGLADLISARARTALYWYDAPEDWSVKPPSGYIDQVRCENVRSAEFVFAVSAAQVRVARALRPGREATVHYLPVGADCEFFDPAKIDRAAARASFGFGVDDIVIGYLGYLGKFQNRFAGQALLEAAALVRAPHVRYLVIGSGPAFEDWQRIVHELGLAKHFTFTEFIPTADLPTALAATDICVDTLEPGFHSEARSETKLKQYMAMGRACVATDIGENRVDLDDGKAGALAAPNPRALADAIDGLAHSPAIRDLLGKRARARALQKYDWKVLARAMSAALLDTAIAATSGKPQSPALR